MSWFDHDTTINKERTDNSDATYFILPSASAPNVTTAMNNRLSQTGETVAMYNTGFTKICIGIVVGTVAGRWRT